MRGAFQKSVKLTSKYIEVFKTACTPSLGISLGALEQRAAISSHSLSDSVPPKERGSENTRSTLWKMAASLAVLGLLQQKMHSTVAHAEPEQAASKDNSSEEDADTKYRRVRQKHGLPKEIILYQYEVCPFCNKVRAFLDYHNVPYRIVEVNPLTKKQIKWSDYKKVPVIMLDDEVVNDSSIILSRMACEFEDRPPDTTKKGWFSKAKEAISDDVSEEEEAEEIRWRKWVDKTFVQLITVNIYRTVKESWQTFDYITTQGNFNFFEKQAARVSGAGLMYGISGRLIKKYGIEGDLREALYAAANKWTKAVGQKQFHGGSKPDLADISLFGVIRSVTGTDTFQDLMHESEISGWYERMMAVVGASSRLPA